MAVSEQLVQDVVKEVVAKLQINADVSGSKGVFADMDTAIEAAKQAQKKVRTMSMDQREKIISIIRRKTKENAEILARMGVQETGMGNVGHKILKHHLVAERTPGTEDITTTAWSEYGRQGADPGGDGAFRGYRCDYPMHQPYGNDYMQYHWDAGRREYGGVQPPSGGD